MDDNSFVRWQGTSIKQLGYASNLVLGLCTASLGFAISLLTDKDFCLYFILGRKMLCRCTSHLSRFDWIGNLVHHKQAS